MNMLDRIKAESQGGLVLCFVGVGSAFAKKNAQCSLIIAKGGKTILVDIGTSIPVALAQQGIPIFAFDHYFITHTHADHVGGIEELLLLSRYVKKQRVPLIITEAFYDILWDKTLRGGCEHNETALLKFSDLVVPIKPTWMQSQPREIFHVNVDGIDLKIFRTAHIPGDVDRWEMAFWSAGLLIDDTVLFTADTRFDPTLFQHLGVGDGVKAIFHDCQLFNPGTVHASYDELKTLPEGLRRRIHLTHYGDTFDQFDAPKDGFAGFAQPWKIYKWHD